jgi:hypothetical protein
VLGDTGAGLVDDDEVSGSDVERRTNAVGEGPASTKTRGPGGTSSVLATRVGLPFHSPRALTSTWASFGQPPTLYEQTIP